MTVTFKPWGQSRTDSGETPQTQGTDSPPMGSFYWNRLYRGDRVIIQSVNTLDNLRYGIKNGSWELSEFSGETPRTPSDMIRSIESGTGLRVHQTPGPAGLGIELSYMRPGTDGPIIVRDRTGIVNIIPINPDPETQETPDPMIPPVNTIESYRVPKLSGPVPSVWKMTHDLLSEEIEGVRGIKVNYAGSIDFDTVPEGITVREFSYYRTGYSEGYNVSSNDSESEYSKLRAEIKAEGIAEGKEIAESENEKYVKMYQTQGAESVYENQYTDLLGELRDLIDTIISGPRELDFNDPIRILAESLNSDHIEELHILDIGGPLEFDPSK